MRSILFLAALATVGGLTPQAMAQDHYRRSARPPAPNAADQPGFYCRPMCPQDMTPCDPIQYKVTDGRCVAPGTGRF